MVPLTRDAATEYNGWVTSHVKIAIGSNSLINHGVGLNWDGDSIIAHFYFSLVLLYTLT